MTGYIRLSALVLTLASLAGTASAENLQTTIQTGVANRAITAQAGKGNMATTVQHGTGNGAATTQAGTFNAATTVQVGSGLNHATTQLGNMQSSTSFQGTTNGKNVLSRTATGGNAITSATISFSTQ